MYSAGRPGRYNTIQAGRPDHLPATDLVLNWPVSRIPGEGGISKRQLKRLSSRHPLCPVRRLVRQGRVDAASLDDAAVWLKGTAATSRPRHPRRRTGAAALGPVLAAPARGSARSRSDGDAGAHVRPARSSGATAGAACATDEARAAHEAFRKQSPPEDGVPAMPAIVDDPPQGRGLRMAQWKYRAARPGSLAGVYKCGELLPV